MNQNEMTYHKNYIDTHLIYRYVCMNVPKDIEEECESVELVRLRKQFMNSSLTLNLVLSRKPRPQTVHLYLSLTPSP